MLACLILLCTRKLHKSLSSHFVKQTTETLFKTNDVISECFVNFSEAYFSNMPIFFVEKMFEALIFSTKKFSVLGY